MTDITVPYLAFGLGVYSAAVAMNLESCKRSTLFENIKGFCLSIFLWPAALYVLRRLHRD